MPKTYIVEHLDPELGPWSALEYAAIASETHAAGSMFMLSSVPKSLVLPPNLETADGLSVAHDGVEELFHGKKGLVCLLDPAAETELSPADGDVFEVFLFGGILGTSTNYTKVDILKLMQEQATIRLEVRKYLDHHCVY
jgi:ribosome biogenesis SPOUT family RNA methylase Rps3